MGELSVEGNTCLPCRFTESRSRKAVRRKSFTVRHRPAPARDELEKWRGPILTEQPITKPRALSGWGEFVKRRQLVGGQNLFNINQDEQVIVEFADAGDVLIA